MRNEVGCYYYWLNHELLTRVLGSLGNEYVTVSLLKTLDGTRLFKTRLTSEQVARLFLTQNYPDELDSCREIDTVRNGHWVKEPKGNG